MAVDDVEVCSVQSGEGACDGGADPGWRVVEGGGGYASDFGEEVVGCAWSWGGGEGRAEEGFGGSVVRGGVECGYAGGEGLVDYGGCGEEVRGGVVLVVEGCGAEDERGEEGGEGGTGGRHGGEV